MLPLIVFDWDETLICSEYLIETKTLPYLTVNCARVRKQLAKLDEASFRILSLAKKQGRVCILTNAQKQWVIISAESFLPKTYNLVRGLQIISAKDHSINLDADPQRWKPPIFEHFLETLAVNASYVIGIGDSEGERQALIEFNQRYPDRRVFTIMIKSNPYIPEELVDCLDEVASLLLSIPSQVTSSNFEIDTTMTSDSE